MAQHSKPFGDQDQNEQPEHLLDLCNCIIEAADQPMVILDTGLRVRSANPAFYKMFPMPTEAAIGRTVYELGNGQWRAPRLRELLEKAVVQNAPLHSFEIELNLVHAGKRLLRMNTRRLPTFGGNPRLVLLSIDDFAERSGAVDDRHRLLFQTSKDGIIVLDAATYSLVDVNASFLEMTGYTREELEGKNLAKEGPLRNLPQFKELIDDALRHPMARQDGVILLARDGRESIVEIVANRFFEGAQELVQFDIRDVSQRQHTESALRESEERFRFFVESVRDYAMFMMDLKGDVVSWNAGAERIVGYKEDEILGRSAALVFTPEDIERGAFTEELTTAHREGRAEDERWHMRRDGTRFWGSGVVTLVRDDEGRMRGFAKVMRDQTERKLAHDALQAALGDKEMLLREIHHRVKNNLQVITSLLNLHVLDIKDEKLRRPFEDLRIRVRAIGRIHDQLNKLQLLNEIDVSENLRIMAQDLRNIYGFSSEQIRIVIDTDGTRLNIDQAMPVGLIINELVSNSMKYAFADGRQGEIVIRLKAAADHNIRLEVRDNGGGLPSDADLQNPNSLGLRLTNIFVDQLEGTMRRLPGAGARFEITFPA